MRAVEDARPYGVADNGYYCGFIQIFVGAIQESPADIFAISKTP